MRACIITPFHDLRWRDNALANVARSGLPAVFALNGAARDTVGYPVATVMCADSQAAGLNAGMAWARYHGFDAALSFDSDDYYGPKYAAATLAALQHADIVGRRRVFAQLSDGLHLFDRPGRSFLFATVGFRLECALPVTDTLDSCHDWCERMRDGGARLAELGPQHYCYRRHSDNAHWRLPSDIWVRAAWGPSLFFGRPPLSAVDNADLGRGLPGCYMMPAPSDAELTAALGAT